MNSTRILIPLLTVFLFACSEPLPEHKSDYLGEWQGQQMSLFILQDGTVAYRRVEGNTTTSIDGPIKTFIDDDFVVGILFLTTRFNVSQPPTQLNGQWQMVVDGVQLTKIEEQQ